MGLDLGSGPIYVRPVDIVPSAEFPQAPRLTGGPLAFRAVDVVVREPGAIRVARTDIGTLAGLKSPEIEALMARLSAPRAPIAGMSLERPRVMGIVNVTPDSFSDGGDHAEAGAAIAHGRDLVEAGADCLDIGGESTRPGSEPVPIDREIARIEPVVRALASDAPVSGAPVSGAPVSGAPVSGAPVSIDSRNAAVMRVALDAGATIVNDVSALRHDADAMALVSARGVPVALMHMLGEPKTMQQDPHYDFAPIDVFDMLRARVEACEAAGIPRGRILIDPGFGFGKTIAHNMQVTDWLALFHGLGCPVLYGASRKSSIGALSKGEAAKDRVPGSLALALAAAARGAHMIRVHDVRETVQALKVWQALES
jgi:dihydropteroate synthase